jgi:hypothetical protein
MSIKGLIAQGPKWNDFKRILLQNQTKTMIAKTEFLL